MRKVEKCSLRKLEQKLKCALLDVELVEGTPRPPQRVLGLEDRALGTWL